MIIYEKIKSLFDYHINNVICALREIICKPEMDKVHHFSCGRLCIQHHPVRCSQVGL